MRQDTDPALLSFSREAIAKGSKSFARASTLFDPAIRDDVMMLYAWCRHCDDVIDGQTLGHDQRAVPQEIKRARAQELREKTVAACAGIADDPPFQALRHVVGKHRIDPRHPLELIDGFEMDAADRSFQTIEETLLYCYHVAGVVGIMMAGIMGVKDAPVLERAADLGIAFQLTNIARDVGEDARAGRIFLPLDWLRDAGLPTNAQDLSGGCHDAALHALAVRLIDYAEPFYDSARHGVAELPYRSAWAIASALEIYRDIGVLVKRRGERDGRVFSSGGRKLWHVGRSALGAGVAIATRPSAHPVRPDLWKRSAA